MGLLSVREVISFRRTCNEKMWKQQYITWDYVRKKGNQYAQYVLGKLYLCGRDVSRDREKGSGISDSIGRTRKSVCQFLLEHLDAYQDPSLFLAATRLLHHLEKAVLRRSTETNGNEAVSD